MKGSVMKQSFRAVLSDAIAGNARRDERIVVLNADSARATNIYKLYEEFPKRMFCFGISEADMLSTAAGMSSVGLKPIVVGFAMFVTVKPFEQIRQAIAYPNLNVKIIATHAGLCVGKDGATHQALEDMALMRTLPNFTVMAAADVQEAKSAIDAIIRHDGPAYLRLGRDLAEDLFPDGKPVRIGGSDVVRDGADVSIAACGLMVEPALRAAEILAGRGVSASVVNYYSIKPLDEERLLAEATKTGALVSVEDHFTTGGLGGAIAEFLIRNHPAPMESVGVRDSFGESGDQDELYEKFGLSPTSIAAAAERAIARKRGRSA